MKILKSFVNQDSRTDAVSRAFDRVIMHFDFPWNLDVMELHVRDQNKVFLNEGTCIIIVDYNDMFVKQEDSRGIAILVLRSLFKAIFKMSHGESPEVVEDVAVNRKMIRNGYGDELVYYYYQKNIGREARSVEEQLQRDVAWLSFHGLDKYDSQFLKDKNKFPQMHKLHECLKKDLEGDALDHAKRAYNELVKECR